MRTHASRLRAALHAVLALSLAAEATACDSTGEAARGAPASDAGSEAACAPVSYATVAVPDAGPSCSVIQVVLPCGAPADPLRTDCYPSVDLCSAVCPLVAVIAPCEYAPESCLPDGSILPDAAVILGCPTCVGDLGRRPRGLAPYAAEKSGSALADWLAGAAFLEAASVLAFRELSRALASFGAPRALVRACARAEADEQSHARSAARMARRLGATPPRPRVRRRAAVSLEAVLVENATEGCVRETYGALVAMHQAARARDAGIARHSREIAVDEARHASLAWRVHAWGMTKLDAPARARVMRARDRAIRALRDEACVAAPRTVVEAAGVPTPRVARALVDRFVREVVSG